jgi:hypothetical protein
MVQAQMFCIRIFFNEQNSPVTWVTGLTALA